MSKKITKAVIPAAGFGTRFLPATKSMPKEMIPIIDKPMIHFVVEEAVKSGIEEIIFITGRGKRSLEDYFDHSYELEHQLELTGKTELANQLKEISDMAEIVYIRQKEALGLGHAVLRAKKLVGDEPFAVLLPDMIVESEVPYTKQLIDVFEEKQLTTIGFKETTPDKVSSYGIAAPAEQGPVFKLKGLVEKPTPEEAPSNLYIFGRYILTPLIFEVLENTKPGKGSEIQLTDALNSVIETEGGYGALLKGTDFDTGDKLGFLKATIYMAMKHEKLGENFSYYLEGFIKK